MSNDDDRVIHDLNSHSGTYFGQYLAYLFGVVLIATALDWLGIFDSIVSNYAQKSYKNLSGAIHRYRFKKEYARVLAVENYQNLPLPEKLCLCCSDQAKNIELHTERAEEEWKNWQNNRRGTTPDDSTTSKSKCCCCSCTNFYQPEKFSSFYFTELLNLNYLATTAYEAGAEGDKVNICGLFNLHFAPGFLNDFLFYLMNKHSLLSMFMAVRGHPYSRFARRITFLAVNCAIFLFVVMVNSDGVGLTNLQIELVSVLFLAPLSIVARRWFFSLLVCPCLRSYHESKFCFTRFMARCLQSCGKFLAYPSLLLFISFLLFAAMATSQKSSLGGAREIVFYARSVMLVSFFQEILHALTVFWNGEACFGVYFFGVRVFGYGGYFRDKVHVLGLRGLRKSQFKLQHLQGRLERRNLRVQERMAREQYGDETTQQQQQYNDDDHDEERGDHSMASVSSITMSSGMFAQSDSLTTSPSTVSAAIQTAREQGRFDYVVQEVEWLSRLTGDVLRVDFFITIPFVRELDKELRHSGEVGDMQLSDLSKSKSCAEGFREESKDPSEVANPLRSVDVVSTQPPSSVDKGSLGSPEETLNV